MTMAKKSDPTWQRYYHEYRSLEDRIVAPFFSTPELKLMRQEEEAKKEGGDILEQGLLEFNEKVGS